nr:ankyrin repeat domain-containing protein [Kofleriaceae bacterium]
MGRLGFADARCLEAGLDAFAARCSELDGLAFDGLTVRFDLEYAAPAEVHAATVGAVEAMASFAKAGAVAVSGDTRRRIAPGKRTTAAGLGAGHRRWEVYLAAAAGELPALRALRTAGVAVDGTVAGGRTALHAAAAAGKLGVIGWLIAAGVAVDREDDAGATALAVASNAKTARRVLAAGAACTPRCLDVADGDGRDDVVEVLLEAGARPSRELATRLACRWIVRDRARVSALAARDAEFADVLREPAVLGSAFATGDLRAVELVRKHGAVVPLARAVEAGMTSLVRAALRAGASGGLSSRVDDAMCIAAGRGALATMKLLERHGVPVQPAAPGDTSPLHEAARTSETACVTWLVARGVSIDAVDAEGHTALQRVFQLGWVDDCVALARLGADLRRLERSDLSRRQSERLARIQAAVATRPRAGGTRRRGGAK